MTGGGGTLKILTNDTFRYSKYNDIFFLFASPFFLSQNPYGFKKNDFFVYYFIPIESFQVVFNCLNKKIYKHVMVTKTFTALF